MLGALGGVVVTAMLVTRHKAFVALLTIAYLLVAVAYEFGVPHV